MDMGHYILKGKEPVSASLLEWGQWFGTADRHVNKTKVGDVDISTVFLGIDHNYGSGPPLLFETMAFGGKLDQECERYSTWIQAEQGHQAMVERVKKAQPPLSSNLNKGE
jgi:hypothetical protein